MKTLKTLSLVILLVLFIMASGIFILAKGAQKTILQPSFYEHVVEETETAPILMETFIKNVESQAPSGSENLSEEQLQGIKNTAQESFSRALSEEWADKTAIKIIEDALAYLKGEQDGLTAVIDLKERKNIIRNNLEQTVEEELKNEIPEQYQGRITPQMKNWIQSEKEAIMSNMLSNIPDQISLAESLEKHPESEQIKKSVASFQKVYNYLNAVLYATLGVLIILMLVVAGFWGGLKWIGSGMIVAGVMLFGGLFGLKQSLLVTLKSGVSDMAITLEKLNLLTKPFFNTLNTIIGIYAGIGLVLLLIGIFVKKYKKGS
ncbi:MAG TPA: hypothetical protein VKO42_00020 [Patescibacteria group bacterium]|nr:hypothetical protein [Patescibacteria group bacterium]